MVEINAMISIFQKWKVTSMEDELDSWKSAKYN